LPPESTEIYEDGIYEQYYRLMKHLRHSKYPKTDIRSILPETLTFIEFAKHWSYEKVTVSKDALQKRLKGLSKKEFPIVVPLNQRSAMLYRYHEDEIILVYNEPVLRKLLLLKDTLEKKDYERQRENYYYYILLHLKPHASPKELISYNNADRSYEV